VWRHNKSKTKNQKQRGRRAERKDMDDKIALDPAASVREDAVLNLGSVLHITSTENKENI